MNNKERRQLEMLIQVRNFGLLRGAEFAPESVGGTAFLAIGEVVNDLMQFVGDKSLKGNLVREKTNLKSTMQKALFEDLKRISRTARIMSERNPGFQQLFQLPRFLNELDLLAKATAFLANAEPLAAEFVRYEMPADFIERLREQIQAFGAAVNHRNVIVESASALNVSIQVLLKKGMELARRLDVVVHNKYAGDVGVLKAWERASRVERPARASVSQARPKPVGSRVAA